MSDSDKINKFGKSLIVPATVAFFSWFGESLINYIIKSKTGMSFSFKSFAKNMVIITTVGTVIEYNRIAEKKQA